MKENSWKPTKEGKRLELLSITHKSHSDHGSEFFVGELRCASPDPGVARLGIVGASEIAA
jgi:hypothetical protein